MGTPNPNPPPPVPKPNAPPPVLPPPDIDDPKLQTHLNHIPLVHVDAMARRLGVTIAISRRDPPTSSNQADLDRLVQAHRQVIATSVRRHGIEDPPPVSTDQHIADNINELDNVDQGGNN